MPPRTQKRKTSTPIRFNRAKKPRAPAAVPKAQSIAPFPIRQVRTLTYCDSAILATNESVDVATVELRANSIFDPVATGTGHQPYAHDTFETLYEFYSVKSAVIDVWFGDFNGEGTNPTFPTMCGVWTNNDATQITNKNLVREQPNSISKLMVNDGTVQVRGTYMRDNRYPAYGQNSVGAAFGASPSELSVFNIFTAKDASLTTAASIACYYKITYEVEMWDPKKLGLS